MKNQIDFQNLYLFRLIKISITKNQIDFQKFIPADKNINYNVDLKKLIPVSADKNINYEEPD